MDIKTMKKELNSLKSEVGLPNKLYIKKRLKRKNKQNKTLIIIFDFQIAEF